ncbi:MAG TPA: siphovirus Gp157 family protein [Oligoflexus sp.]|uniref:siphovirus Gp157 family protein n=1 Tax=Oligoflexus sp. TaxID=1971216 RepID=UPI002D313D37|nr:siphovirus Gp157 family protein [Oligoflexus sp.]HYX38357.1 siphovirus Gp157 family protein [Oligoflexus sp.]
MSNKAEKLNFHDEDPEEPKPKKRTLADLLELMKRAEDEIDHCEIDLEELGTAIRSKIDHIVEYLDYCDEKAQTLRTRMKLFERKAKAYENRSKYLREYVAYQLATDASWKGDGPSGHDGKPCMSGDLYQMSLQFHDFVEVNSDANAIAFLKLGPPFVERRYTWNKRALKAALESKSEIVAGYAELKKRPHIKIDVKT